MLNTISVHGNLATLARSMRCGLWRVACILVQTPACTERVWVKRWSYTTIITHKWYLQWPARNVYAEHGHPCLPLMAAVRRNWHDWLDPGNQQLQVLHRLDL